MTASASDAVDLAVIPAKARSTRFPGKNVALLAGAPLVVHAVRVAKESGLFETVVLSTDDPKVAELAREAGAEVPFMRDPALAGDTVEVPAVVRNAVEWYQHNRDSHFQSVCVLQPTCPLRTTTDLVDSRKLLDAHPRADVVVSVSRYHHHPYWALRFEDDRVVPDRPQSATESRQHLPELYHPDGTVYWCRIASLLSTENIYDGIVIPYCTPADSVLDIDYPEDLKIAEWRLQQRTRT
jgi:N-acylneuraminate cytidylyltransferase/CMP-N,N'-diacetyllegionaminic acid synthase